MDFDMFTAPTTGKDRKRKTFIVMTALFLVIIGTVILFFMSRSQAPPKQVVSMVDSVNFPVYYPSKLPVGYSYVDSSAKFQSGFLYYKLHNGTKVITVTQQGISSNAVNLHKLPSYSSLNVPAGPAAIGISVGNPSVVIATGSTLVSLNSTKGVSKDTVVAIAKRIRLVPLPSGD